MIALFLDTESTDRDGQICQLAYLIVDGDRVTGRNFYFAADAMSPGAQAVHGMSLADTHRLSGGKRFADHAEAILSDLARADIWAGHNIASDLHMLNIELQRLHRSLPQVRTFCSMNAFTPILKLRRLRGPGSPKPPKLTELCAHYGVDEAMISAHCRQWFGADAASHDARYDACATYLALLTATKKGDLSWPPHA